jgi:hypothetical protein
MAIQKALATQSVSLVNGWIAFATMALTGYKNSLLSGLGDPLNAFNTVVEALNKHFHFDKVDDPVVRIDTILTNYRKIATATSGNATVWKDVDVTQAKVDFSKQGDSTWLPPPAYAKAGQGVFFTPQFREWDATSRTGFGPKCRGAMVLHESAHYIDAKIIDYAYEWQTNPYPCLAQFVPGFFYDTLDPDLALKNASSYATFAIHISRGADQPRFGAGNPSM